MKQYPCGIIGECDLDTMEPNGVEYKVPTLEAYQNFESYLDPDELEFYNKLSEGGRLQLALCVNPFNGLLQMMGKK